MRHYCYLSVSVLLSLATPVFAAEGDDNLSVSAKINQTWDSNYNRSRDSSSEQITEASIATGINKTISRQTLGAKIGASRYRHHRRDFLDASLYRGSLSWQGALGNRASFGLSWIYRDRLAERVDFIGRDIINLDEKEASLKYSVYAGWALVGGVRDAQQTHSNDGQASLDYDEQDYNAGIQYKSGRGSTMTLRYTEGDRHYLNPASGGLPDVDAVKDLDYDYQRTALETEWQVTGKTLLTSNVGYFDRDGEVNSGNGLEASIQADWQATDKTSMVLLYGFDQPAVGEDSNNPSEVHRLVASLSWEWTAKITLDTSVRVAFQEFDDSLGRVPRDEESYSWRPLALNYAITDTISARFASGWQKRESPIDERNYTAREFSIGLFGEF
jgi:hypothetical protein